MILAAAGFGYESISELIDERRHQPPGRLVDIGGYRLHLHRAGKGSPTVILDSGLGGSSLQWRGIQPLVARFTSVCSYDRAGLGWSDAGPNPRTSGRIAEELHRLLGKSGVKPPYVLAGHSFGGFNARLFASKYPSEVAGIVLVDSASEEALPRITREEKQEESGRALREGFWYSLAARFGLIRLYVNLMKPKELMAETAHLPASAREDDMATRFLPNRILAAAAERASFRDSAEQAKRSSHLEDVPLVVIASIQNHLPGDSMRQAQRHLAALSRRGRLIETARSGHQIHLDEPHLVVQAIKQTVIRVRSKIGGANKPAG